MDKTINLNAYRDKAYKTACEHGFHATELSNEHFLCLVVSELMEAVEADRKGKRADVKTYNAWPKDYPLVFKGFFGTLIKDTVESELADAVIRLLDLAGLRGFDIVIKPGLVESYKGAYENKTFTESIYSITAIVMEKEHPYERTGQKINYAICAIFGLAAHMNIDLIWHIEQKMKYNELRENMHGKKY